MVGRPLDRMLRREPLDDPSLSLETYLADAVRARLEQLGCVRIAHLVTGAGAGAEDVETTDEDPDADELSAPLRTVLEDLVLASMAVHLRHFVTPGELATCKLAALFDGGVLCQGWWC